MNLGGMASSVDGVYGQLLHESISQLGMELSVMSSVTRPLISVSVIELDQLSFAFLSFTHLSYPSQSRNPQLQMQNIITSRVEKAY